MTYKVTEVFTPADQPTHTYVDRSDHRLVDRVRNAFDTPNMIVSVSGPSKTGKTVLIKRCVDADLMIPLFGAAIGSVDDFWRALFAWIEIPEEEVSNASKGWGAGVDAAVSAEGGIILAKVKADLKTNYGRTGGSSVQKTKAIDPFQSIVNEISGSEFVVFIDDFHYINEDVQVEIARIIKSLAERGVKICVASVPHRSDDVVRANQELKGRLS